MVQSFLKHGAVSRLRRHAHCTAHTHLLSGAHFLLGGEELLVRASNVTMRGDSPEGATLDGQGLSRVLSIDGGAYVQLHNVHVINGKVSVLALAQTSSAQTFVYGGGMLIGDEGTRVVLHSSSVRNCTLLCDFVFEPWINAVYGGGIGVVHQAAVWLHDCRIAECVVSGAEGFKTLLGGGISVGWEVPPSL